MTNEELLKVIEEAKTRNAVYLDLRRKELTELPPEIAQLPNLKELYLNYNQLKKLPPEIVQLTRLKVLGLGGNKFSDVPSEICQLTNLTDLYLWRNQFNELPSEICKLINLRQLDLSENRLVSLPPEISQLTNLEEINCDGNPLTSPPLEIANKSIEAIREYFAGTDQGERPLNEVKIILVGEGAAGKTSLVRRVLDHEFDLYEDTTQGISIRKWKPKSDGKDIKVNIWDFGGQEIQHATHQFFLSKRSLYVLVLDGRKEERPEYWLRHIESFGGNSPVLIVLNKYDANPRFDINRPDLLRKFPDIRGFWRTSCKTGQGIASFRDVLRKELSQVEMISICWPQSWFRVKDQINHLNKPYISYEEYWSICTASGINDEKHCDILVDCLHDLGVAIHFKEFVLDDTHVLDPVWVTTAVYKIITSQQVMEDKGTLHLESLKAILRKQKWDKHSFPNEKHVYLIELMKKFELCYSLDNEHVLIPQLLPVTEPDLAFNYSSSLGFVLHYHDFLPPSIMPRFIVRKHEQIKNDLHWRTGVVLEDKASGSKAVVKADEEKRHIHIWVTGPRRKEYLTFLWFSLREINDSFEKLSVSERIPMPDAPHVTADYQTLLNCVKEGMERYMPDGAAKSYSVKELLGLVAPERDDQILVLLRMLNAQIGKKEVFELKPNWNGCGVDLIELYRRLKAGEKLL